MTCPTCGTELTQKRKSLLLVVGFAMLGSIAAISISLWLALPTIIAAIVGIYLILWATRGKALWCRTCKRAPYL